jgi:cytochrome c biogenesis factor
VIILLILAIVLPFVFKEMDVDTAKDKQEFYYIIPCNLLFAFMIGASIFFMKSWIKRNTQQALSKNATTVHLLIFSLLIIVSYTELLSLDWLAYTTNAMIEVVQIFIATRLWKFCSPSLFISDYVNQSID